jgi:hypothetical protein
MLDRNLHDRHAIASGTSILIASVENLSTLKANLLIAGPNPETSASQLGEETAWLP